MTRLERAREIWKKIENNLCDRRGIGLRGLDEDILEELRNSQIGIIAEALPNELTDESEFDVAGSIWCDEWDIKHHGEPALDDVHIDAFTAGIRWAREKIMGKK